MYFYGGRNTRLALVQGHCTYILGNNKAINYKYNMVNSLKKAKLAHVINVSYIEFSD